MIRNLAISLTLILLPGIFLDLKANKLEQVQPENHLVHQGTPPPPVLNSSKDLLLVGLKPYLGRTGQDLKLHSAGRQLILKDQKGIVHKSYEINIGWRKVPLNEPQKIVRQVVGPFSSFESAQEIALKLDEQGIQSSIAHPDDWEVWVADEVELPRQINFVNRTQIIKYLIKPVLKGRNLKLLLSGSISIEAPDGLLWGKGIYKGPFLLIPDAYGSWTLVEKVPFKQYLHGVIPHEIGANSPRNALAAQAILARTWALANMHRFAIDGYHLCSDVQCQVYKDPNKATLAVKEAIEITSGKYLSWNGKPIHAVYHATNGGVMASSNEAWSMDSLPYLRPQLDGSSAWGEQFVLPLSSRSAVKKLLSNSEGANGSNHYLFRWKRILTAENITKTLYPSQKNIESPKRIKVVERGTSGRVIALAILGSEDRIIKILRLDNIRRVLRDLPSTLFIINQLQEGVWEVSGGGFGHGVGLSQAGAISLAKRGWSLNQILSHYYPGTDFRTLP